MPVKNSTLTWRWMQEVWNKGREDAIDEMMDENVIVHGVEAVKEKGPAAFKQFYRDFRIQFPTINFDVQETISEDDLETSRCVVNAVTATGQKIQFSGTTIVRIVNGKIVEGWNHFDFLSMYQQLGYKLVPPEAYK